MTFTFTNYAGIKPRPSPFADIIGKVLGGYSDMTKAKFMPREKEAEIFNKQISPLAMLASSPFFSSMQPEQQHQIASYISKMMANQGIGGQGGQGGVMGGGQSQGGMGQQGAGSSQNGGQQGGYGADDESLTPSTPGEHFTNQYTQSPFSPGTAHRTKSGETTYAPTGSNVQKGLDVITESKGLKKLFDNYSKLAPKIGGAGGFKRDFAKIASGVERADVPLLSPLAKTISSKLGTNNLSNEEATAESYKAQMSPALRSIGFSNREISDILGFHPGENEKNIRDRLKSAWPVIERKIKTYQKNLKQGINVNENVMGENEDQGAGGNENSEMMLIAPDGSRGFVPADQAMKLLQSGQFKEAQ